jgi:serpin B
MLKETLSSLGMPTAFTSGADFSRMADDKLFISDVIHQAYIDVDEEGTEAAAATAIVMRLTSVINERVFIANKPFIFLIRDNVSGNILFMGKYVKPEN